MNTAEEIHRSSDPAVTSRLKPYRILSFDGGGVHAVSYLSVVELLEEHVGGGGLAASGAFQMLVGTSTGAIVATALKLGRPAREVIRLYEENAGRIFAKDWWWNRLFHKYSSSTLRTTLAKSLRRHTADDHELTWEELVRNQVNPEVELVVTLWDICKGKRVMLSTDIHREGQEKSLYQARLADIITACCAGPYFFPPRGFGRKGQKEGVYCDGGITGLNNPAALAVALAGKQIRRDGRPLHLFSFGSGQTDETREVRDVERRVAWDIGIQTIDDLMNGSAALMNDFYQAFGGGLGIDRYFRTNQNRSARSKLDDVASLPALLLQFADRRIECVLHRKEDGIGVPGRVLSNENLVEAWELEFGLLRNTTLATEQQNAETVALTIVTKSPLPSREVRTTWWRRWDLALMILGGFCLVGLFLSVVVLMIEARNSAAALAKSNGKLATNVAELQKTSEELRENQKLLVIKSKQLEAANERTGRQLDKATSIFQLYIRRYGDLPECLGELFAVAEEGISLELRAKLEVELEKVKKWAPRSVVDDAEGFEKALKEWKPGTSAVPLKNLAPHLSQSLRSAWINSPTRNLTELVQAEKVVLYRQLIEAVQDLRKASVPANAKKSRLEFWKLYWGRLLFVETPQSAERQVQVGNELEKWMRGDTDRTKLDIHITHLVETLEAEMRTANQCPD